MKKVLVTIASRKDLYTEYLFSLAEIKTWGMFENFFQILSGRDRLRNDINKKVSLYYQHLRGDHYMSDIVLKALHLITQYFFYKNLENNFHFANGKSKRRRCK